MLAVPTDVWDRFLQRPRRTHEDERTLQDEGIGMFGATEDGERSNELVIACPTKVQLTKLSDGSWSLSPDELVN